jgi:hypothetical protein
MEIMLAFAAEEERVPLDLPGALGKRIAEQAAWDRAVLDAAFPLHDQLRARFAPSRR